MPIGAEDTFEGIIDLMTMKAEIYKSDDGKEYEITDIPAEYQEVAEARREMMIDAIAETDDDIMMKYLEGEDSLCAIDFIRFSISFLPNYNSLIYSINPSSSIIPSSSR